MGPMARKLGKGVAIVGSSVTKFGLYQSKNSRDLITDAFTEALQSVDKGIDPNEIEAFFVGNFSAEQFESQSHLSHLIVDALGLAPIPATRIEGACASSSLAFRQGIMAIASGMHNIVLVGGVEKMSSASSGNVQQYLSSAGDVPMEIDQGAFTFPGLYAAMSSAYMARYGTNRRHLMHVTIKNHENASINPMAQLNFSIKEVMARHLSRTEQQELSQPKWRDEFDFLTDPLVNPMVAWPLHIFDCAPVTDGASCIILTSEDIASLYTEDTVTIAASAQASAGPIATWGNDITSIPSSKKAATEAYTMARVSPEDIDIAEVHDCFTSAEIIAIEDLGFFHPGQGAFASADGHTSRHGDRAINVSGGLKAKGHPVGATGVAQIHEIFIQLRGVAGDRQICHKDLRLGLTHNVGGTGGTCVVHILERN